MTDKNIAKDLSYPAFSIEKMMFMMVFFFFEYEHSFLKYKQFRRA